MRPTASRRTETSSGTRLALLVALGLATLPAGAQPPRAGAPPSTDEETFFESIDVNVVNVEVVVTDRSGKRITDLTKDDFELREDGKPIAIANFYAVAGKDYSAEEGEAPAVAGAAGEAPAPEKIELPDDQQLYLALFVDNRNLTPSSRGRMLQSIREQITNARLSPRDRLVVITYDGSVKIRQTPTADPAALAAALDEVAKSPTRGHEAELDRRRILQEISQGGVPPAPGSESEDSSDLEAAKIYAGIRNYTQIRTAENELSLRALGQVVDSLAGLPGRKALLYVTGGISLRPGEAIYQAWADKYEKYRFDVGASQLDILQFDSGPMLNRLIERANANRVTFYTLGAPDGISSHSAETQGGAYWSRELERTESLNLQQPLISLAGATGGLSAFDPASPGNFLDRLRTDLGSYYSLGYTPSRRPDGKRHSLDVKVRRAGLSVRHREAHRDRLAEERMTDQTLSALLFGESDNPLEGALEIEAERPGAKKGEVEVSVLVKVPMAKLVLLPQEHVHEGRLRVFVAARDAAGRTSDVTVVDAPIRIPNESLLTALGQIVGCRVTLVLRPGEHTLAAGIWDDIGKADSTVLATYNAGAQAAAAALPGDR